MDEIIPIEHSQSADQKVEGCYIVEEPGNYVLVFDNTFSRNTPKKLTFAVTLCDPPPPEVIAAVTERRKSSIVSLTAATTTAAAGNNNSNLTNSCNSNSVISGWLLKKRRKKMQGYAKRWFSLSHTGALSYSTAVNSVSRGSIQILVSTISYTPNLRQINIDSGTMIYHLKAMTETDYHEWQRAFTNVRKTHGFNSAVGGSNGASVSSPYEGLHNDQHPTRILQQRISSSLSHNQHLLLRAEIEQGVETSQANKSNMEALVNTIEQLKQVLISNDLKSIQGIIDQFDRQKLQLSSTMSEQLSQWKNVQNYYTQHRSLSSSGSRTPILDSREDDLLYERSAMNRSSSLYSSDQQYYDAEDIILSDMDEESMSTPTQPSAVNTNEDMCGISRDDDEYGDDDDDDDDEDDDTVSSSLTTTSDGGLSHLSSQQFVTRRAKLPSPAMADPESTLSVFRKNIGKDLSTIAMPVSMNEPLNMLQKACEELEYCELIDKAATFSNPLDRLMYITVYVISTYASSQYRTGRKPFNPMMTETYENIRPDKGFRFVSEKVSHNPLIIAAHAESRNYTYWQSTQIKSKFWGKSMEFMTEGTFHITLKNHDDHYTFFKPSSWMKNMIAGEKYLEHSGECKVMNHTTGDTAVIVFKEGSGGGLFGAPTKRNDVIATLYNKAGGKVKRLTGKWSEAIAEEVGMDKNKLNVLWTAKPPQVANYDKFFGFTKFATELNEITEIEQGKLPITDTRLRPDQRLYEEGLVDEADNEKLRIEQQQRERRKKFEMAGQQWKPRWFTLTDNEQEWSYAGEYWPTRESGQWPKDQFPLW
ncbi:Oxysterol-binding protein-domain-containing protein [Mycotypha africana]|uniref:Oxysterol-binding protein-domain-containing protein n=1 Tax=Mycotypha africana TaxID=64632 RepID=UPI0023014DFB|nr:Oxysterol-binding protein-domain-containing protein [Mycotypha africana]KAI8991539.1 Oxysterol-binding protein-domain-containing protein [Mycotypha africana]